MNKIIKTLIITTILLFSTLRAETIHESIPNTLSSDDVKIYKEMISNIENGKSYLSLTRKLENKSMLPYIEAINMVQNTTNERAARWFNKYHNLGITNNLYNEITTKNPSYRQFINNPTVVNKPPVYGITGDSDYYVEKLRQGTDYNNLRKYYYDDLRFGKPSDAARNLLEQRKKYNSNSWSLAAVDIAQTYFSAHDYEKALIWSNYAIKDAPYKISQAYIIKGMILFLKKEYEEAFLVFSTVPDKIKTGNTNMAISAYWAGRVALLLGNEEDDYIKYLKIAKDNGPDNIYSQLAIYQLGEKLVDSWDNIPLNENDIAPLFKNEQIKKIIALWQLDLHLYSELELLNYTAKNRGNKTTLKRALALANYLRIPSVQINLAPLIKGSTGFYANTYPILPEYHDIRFDTSVIHGIIRQESRFYMNAKSHADARGLMQILPDTASFMTQNNIYKQKPPLLNNPKINVEIGQAYFTQLLKNNMVNLNVIKALISWNAGSAFIQKWQQRIEDNDIDPLLYIEAIPFKETRDFVKKVLSNIWIYRDRFQEQPITKILIAEGEVPVYYEQY